MILRLSAAVQRHRRRVLLAAAVLGAGAVVNAVLAPSEPTGSLAATGVVAAVALVTGAVVGTAVRWRASPLFEVDEAGRAFRTPRGATPVFLVLFLLAAVTFLAQAGAWPWAHGDRDGGWIVVMVSIGVPALLLAAVAWRGHGIAMTPDGIHAERGTGTLTIPWTALSADQPRPATPPTEYVLDLALTRPDHVTRRGFIMRENRITFEGTQPAFAAAAVRHYAAHPADRSTIGTRAGHERLVELLAAPSGPAEPPPSRRRIAVLAALGAVVFTVAVTGDTWADVTIGRYGFLGIASDVVRQLLALLSFSLFAAAIRGMRDRRRQAPQDAPPAPPQPAEQAPPTRAPTTMPSWARDVTGS